MNKIIVLGDLIIDEYIFGKSSRISPEAPVPVVNLNYSKSFFGGAGNVFRNLNALESICNFICVSDKTNLYLSSIVGFDEQTIKLISDKSIKSSIKQRVISNNQQIVRIDQETTNDISKKSQKKILEILEKEVSQIDIIILSDYDKGVLTSDLCKKVIKIANCNKIKVLVDPKSKIECFKGAYLFKPNLNELSFFLDKELNDRKDIEHGVISIFNMYNFKNIMVTLGSDGILHYDGNKFIHSKSIGKEVYDVSGAGDTVISAYAHSLRENKEIIDTLDFCNKAASVVVSKFGTAVATKKELYEEN